MDAGDTLGIVSAENELLYHLCDTLDTESAVDDSILVFVLIGDALKMVLEQELDGGVSSRPVHRLRDRSDLKG